jgi:hypothetical protein
MLGARAGALAVAASCIAGCTASTAKRPTEGPRAVSSPLSASVDVGRPRLVPPTTGSTLTFDTASDGSRYLISFGLRVLERPDGSVELAEDFFPTGRNPSALALPERLGGGFVFYTASAGTTLFFRAKSWTAPLEPIAQIDGEMARVVAGFDRLYLQRDRRTPWIGLDLEGPRVTDLAGLPPAPAYGAMAFADEWFGAVEVPYRGLLVTFDAGASYRPAGVNATNLFAKDGELRIESRDALLALGADGTLRPVDRPVSNSERSSADSDRRRPKPGPFGRRPLELAVLHGVAIAKDRALVAAGGALGEIDLLDGSVVRVKEKAYAGNAVCHGIKLGRGVGFLCSESAEKTVVLAYRPPHDLDELIAFDGPRYVAPNAGALAIRGSCRSDGAGSGLYCIVPREGAPYELRVEGDLGVERVVALEDGRAAVLIPPRFGAKGSLAIVEPSGREKRVTLEVPKTNEPSIGNLVKHGFWLNGFEQLDKETIRGWVAGDGPLVGVRVKFDGKVELGKIEHGGVERSLISGRYALVLGRGGALVESSDGGFTWRDLELPGDPQLARPRGSLSSPTNGCSEIGCAFGGWLRIGYGKSEEDGALKRVSTPKALRVPSPGGGRWSLDCSPTGEMSPPAQASPPRAGIAEPGSDDRPSGTWLPFWEEAPPKLANGEVGYDIGTESELSQMRAYVWGPSSGDFSRAGKWLVRVADRQRIGGAIWSTAVSRTPWGSADITADVFGYSPSGSISAFRILLEPGGRAALLTITSRGKYELYLLEEGRAIVPLRTPGAIGSPNAWVKVGTSYYLGTTTDSRSFRVYRASDGALELFAEYPDLQGVFLSPTLVRDSRGEALAVLAKAASTFIHPIDLTTGRVGAPLELPASKLASMPRACTGTEEGWLITGPVGPDPFIDFPRQEGRVSMRAFEARLIAGEDLCAESLSVQGDLPSALRPVAGGKAEGVPMVLSDRGERGRRVGYRCTN